MQPITGLSYIHIHRLHFPLLPGPIPWLHKHDLDSALTWGVIQKP